MTVRRVRLAGNGLLFLLLALVVGILFGSGGGGGGSGCSPGCYTYPQHSMGAGNIYYYGVSYDMGLATTLWNANSAGQGFVMQAGRASVPAEQSAVNHQRLNSLGARALAMPIYVYFCVYTDSNQAYVNDLVDSLYYSNFIDDANQTSSKSVIVVFDIETDPEVCGNWDSMSFTAAKSKIDQLANWIKQR